MVELGDELSSGSTQRRLRFGTAPWGATAQNPRPLQPSHASFLCRGLIHLMVDGDDLDDAAFFTMLFDGRLMIAIHSCCTCKPLGCGRDDA